MPKKDFTSNLQSAIAANKKDSGEEKKATVPEDEQGEESRLILKRKRKDKTNKRGILVTLETDLIDGLDKKAKQLACSRNELIKEMLTYAIDHLEIQR
jgi:hypothetical protein